MTDCLGGRLISPPARASARKRASTDDETRRKTSLTTLVQNSNQHNACSIWFYTRFLSDADAAEADAVLAAAAPRVKQDTLAAKAAKLEMKLDPRGGPGPQGARP